MSFGTFESVSRRRHRLSPSMIGRSVGDTTDVVEKQMYTFEDKGGRSITLRPEGTAGAVRAMLENGLYNGGYPVKLYYKTSCYRYEKPQAGRLRELHQFGVEMFGWQVFDVPPEITDFINAVVNEGLEFVKNFSYKKFVGKIPDIGDLQCQHVTLPFVCNRM